MRTFVLVATALIIFASSSALSQEQVQDVEDADPCIGTWVLNYRGNWSATREEDGLTMNITVSTTILDCGGSEGTLKENMHNEVKAVVRCAHSQNGDLYVNQLQIICE